MKKTRMEKDSLGEREVPAAAYYGIQTLRAVENFPVSGWVMPPSFIRALALVKEAAVEAHMDLGTLDRRRGRAVLRAAREVSEGRWRDQFPVDIFQTGSGTSTNMNMNEVLANRANELLGGAKGTKAPVHPNDHVNKGQSSNDVIPTALHVAALTELETRVLPALRQLEQALTAKSRQFGGIVKIGRTHLQDAVPMTLGQEFGGYASQVRHGIRRLMNVRPHLRELALGGTAVGTGVNTDRRFIAQVIRRLSRLTGLSFRGAPNRFEALAARDAAVETSGALKTMAVSLIKIANDLRWLSSGPRCGLGEIELPALQPGSSIMPGKINPVIPEAAAMVGARIIGADAAITVAGQSGNFELNVMIPLIAHDLLGAMDLLASAARLLADKCVKGITARRDVCEKSVEKSLAMATALVPVIGYDRAAEIAKESRRTGKTVRQICREQGILADDRLREVLDPRRMTHPT